MKKQKRVSFFLLGLFMSLICSTMVEAADDPIGFSVAPEIPATQINQEQKYFYIKTTPNHTQELTVKVIGTSEKPVTVNAYAVNASTSEEGTLNYVKDIPKDSTLVESIEDIVTVEPAEFEIRKDQVQIVKITVTPPANSYEGIKLGTLYFSRVGEDDEQAQGAVKSDYSYRIGLMTSEDEKNYSDGKTLKILDVVPELSRARKTIQIQLQNPEPKLIADFSMNLTIVDKKTNKVVKKTTFKDGAMAPNSNFKVAVDWGLDPMPAGNYSARVEANSRYDKWKLQKDFTISSEVAKKLNDETLFKLTLPKWSYYTITGFVVAILIDVSYLGLRKKAWEKQKKQRKRKKMSTKRKKRGE